MPPYGPELPEAVGTLARFMRVEARRSARHGLGVFALHDIAAGDIVERCPVLVVGGDEAEQVSVGALAHHLWDWGEGAVAVALGYGSLYNHAEDPNAECGAADGQLLIIARRDIAAGDEITIDYTNGGAQELWF